MNAHDLIQEIIEQIKRRKMRDFYIFIFYQLTVTIR